MSNIIDYLRWRGDLSFERDPINEIDEVILSRFSYLPFHDIYLGKNENIKSIAKKMEIVPKSNFCWGDDKLLIEELAKTQRFKNLIVTDYVQKVDHETQTQFVAIVIWLPNNEKYISFEGTDMTMLGWKEDFNMSFMNNVPSQIESVSYLEQIAEKYTSKLRLGGHSKGGNLAVYSATFCKDEIKERIVNILNADGPGFTTEVIQDDRYKKIVEKVKTYIPQSSIIGRLLEHEEEYNIVESTQKGIMQHDIYSWQVGPRKLKQIKELTNESHMVNNIVKEWLKNTTIEEREKFGNTLYEIIEKTEAKTVMDFSAQLLKNVKTVIKTYKTMDETEKHYMENMLKLTVTSIITVMKNEILNRKVSDDKYE